MKFMTPINWLHRLKHASITVLVLCAILSISSCDEDEEDTLAPEVSFADLTDGEDVWGVVSILVNAEDNGGIEKIDVYVDGTLLTTITSSPYQATWDTEDIAEGNHIIKIVATDRAGNVAEAEVNVVVNNDEFNDNAAPVVEITAPVANSTVWATVNVSANVTDNRSISKVEFLADGTVFSTITSAPFTSAWNTETLNDGEHILKVVATDKANNTSEKQVTVTVKNTLVTISVPADQLYNQDGWTQRGFVFLNDENGNLIASTEFQNGDQINLKASTFTGETFSVTQVNYSTSQGYTDVNFWTFTKVTRGNWILLKEIPDDEDYAGDATITFTNPAANATYFGVGNGDDQTYVDPFTNEVQTIRLQKAPSKLYVTRYFESGTPAPGYRLYSDIAVGANTINLNQAFTALTKFDFTLTGDMNYISVDYHGYADTEFTEHYDLGYASATSGTLSVYKPAGAFAAYWSEIELETGEYNYFRTSTAADPTSFQLFTYSGSVNYSNNKLTYDVTGADIDLISTVYYLETNDMETSWAFAGPTSVTGSITIPVLPDVVKDFPHPAITSKPAHFTIYNFGSIGNYTDFLSYVRNSTHNIDELYQDGKEAADMSIFQDNTGGRLKKFKHHGLRNVKRRR